MHLHAILLKSSRAPHRLHMALRRRMVSTHPHPLLNYKTPTTTTTSQTTHLNYNLLSNLIHHKPPQYCSVPHITNSSVRLETTSTASSTSITRIIYLSLLSCSSPPTCIRLFLVSKPEQMHNQHHKV